MTSSSVINGVIIQLALPVGKKSWLEHCIVYTALLSHVFTVHNSMTTPTNDGAIARSSHTTRDVVAMEMGPHVAPANKNVAPGAKQLLIINI